MQAVLDGVGLEVASGAAWSQIPGTAPFELTIETDGPAAESLFGAATLKGSKLQIDASLEGLGEQTIEGLTITATSPSNSPHTLRLNIADSRWTWRYGPMLKRSYNFTRKTGAVRKIGDVGTPTGAQVLVDDQGYAPWSLKDETTVWRSKEIIEDVMNGYFGEGGWEDRSGGVSLPDPIQELDVYGPPSVGVGQLLARFGGILQVTVDLKGTPVLYNAFDNAERVLVGLDSAEDRTYVPNTERKLFQVIGRPVWAVQNRRLERPSKVRIFFQRAIEIRIDGTEAVGAAGGTTQRSGAPPRLENVLSLPEDAVIAGRSLPLTTWVTFDEYLTFLKGKQPTGLPDLTRKIIQKGWLIPVLEAYDELDPSGLWGRRISAIREHYRRTFRIDRRWVDRIRLFVARRVAIQDIENRGFAAAPIFQDYAEWRTWRGIGSKTAKDLPKNHEIVRNRFAVKSANGPGGIIAQPIPKLQQAPAIMTMKDPQQGIFTIDLVLDHTGNASRYVRSAVTKDSVPTDDISQKKIYLQEGELVSDFELSVVLTTIPGSPNDNRQLHVEEVSPAQVSELVPGGTGLAADGPVMDIRVEPQKMVARIGWDDGKRTEIYNLFGFEAGAARQGSVDIGEPINKQFLREFALAKAAQIYAQFADHVEGGLTTSLRPGLELAGIASAVTHGADPQDGAFTQVTMAPDPPGLDLGAVLPAGVRKLIEGIVDP